MRSCPIISRSLAHSSGNSFLLTALSCHRIFTVSNIGEFFLICHFHPIPCYTSTCYWRIFDDYQYFNQYLLQQKKSYLYNIKAGSLAIRPPACWSFLCSFLYLVSTANLNFTVYQIFYLQLYFRFISRLALIFPKNPERYMANTINTPKSNPSPALATLS